MSNQRNPLAIVGIGCRMPGGISTPDQLWEMISAGKDGIREVPRDRWDWRSYYSEDLEAPGKIYVRSAGFLQQDIRQFDAEFFGISPIEAMSLDPQQRLLLETSWEAIEDAGLSLDRLSGSRTGVYIGGFTLDNMLTQMSNQNRQNIGANSAASSTMTMLSNRLSYFLDLRGPSISIDTACSSSLVALHLASQALWNNECDAALVGAVNVIFRPEFMVAMCKGHFLAPDGRSKSFDQRANGYGRGEGAGIIVLKPLSAALADRDRIYALVRGTGCNQDGRTNGITVPNPEAQKSLIMSVLDHSEVPAGSIHYVEAHGTGTPVGDPIEARALGETLGRGRQNGTRLIMGSVKANLGHMEAAAGVAGLIKLCMCYKYGAIPPQANLGEPNTNIPFDELGLRLPTALEPLPSEQKRIFFAINSFGYGGTNAHAILENPPAIAAPPEREEKSQPAMLPVSARSESALRAVLTQYRETLTQSGNAWRDVCAAAGLRRTHHNLRTAFVGRNCQELIARIDEWLSSASSTGSHVKRLDGSSIQPVFVFSGMGPQWWGMGRQLFDEEPVFASSLTRADAVFQSISGWSILEEMHRGKDASRITRTIYAQPANFVLQAGLLDLLKSWGVSPAAVIGHSVGEITSAYAAGMLSLEQAIRVSYFRSQIQARAAGLGGMLAVELTEEEALAMIAPFGTDVTIAAINAPKSITLAGETNALDVIASRLQVKSVFHRKLQVEVAYHSAFMDPLQKPLIDALADIEPGLPTLDIYSTVTGARVTERAYDGPYWARNVREPVRFMRALESSIADDYRLFLEVGPHPVLTPSIRECIARNKVEAEVISTLVRETDEDKALYHSLANLYTAGSNPDWTAINGRPNIMITLPSYPWQRETFWGEAERAVEERVGSRPAALAGRRIDTHEPVWDRLINNKYLPYIDDHVVQKVVLMPGAAFVDAALSLQNEGGCTEMPVAVEDLHFKQPLVLDRNQDVLLRTTLDPHSLRVTFYSTSQQQTNWTRHAEARLSKKLLTRPEAVNLVSLRDRVRDTVGVDALYSRLAKLGLEYGPYFRRITELRANDCEVLARVKGFDPIEHYDIEHVFHPTLLDGAFQSLLAAIREDETGFVPASIRQVAVFEPIPDEFWCYGRITKLNEEEAAGDIFLLDNDGRVLSTVSGLRCARVGLAAKGKAETIERLLVRPSWQQTPLEGTKRRSGSWLIIAESGFARGTFAERLADGLRREGCDRVIPISVETPKVQSVAGGINITTVIRTFADWKNLFESYPPENLTGVVYITRDAEANNPDGAIGHAGRLLELFKHLPANDSDLRAYLITHRAQAVGAGDRVDGFMQASATGFFRVAHSEFPGLTCSMIDHDSDDPQLVITELLADDEADDIAFRSGVRYTQHMEPCTLLDVESADLVQRAIAAPSNRRYILACTASGLAATLNPHRDRLYWRQDGSRELAADEIEIEIAYIRDNIKYDDPREVSSHEFTRPKWREFNGRISRAGADVEVWLPGEPIAGAAVCHLASHVFVREKDLRAIKLNAAPSIDSAFLAITAASVRAALQEMARGQKGETVLVISEAHDEVEQLFDIAARELGLTFLAARTGETASGGSFDGAQLDLRHDDFEHRVLAANHGRPVDIVVFCGTVNAALHNRIPLAFGGRVVLYGSSADSVEPKRFVAPATMYSLHRMNPDAFAIAPRSSAALAHLARPLAGPVSPDRLYSAEELPRALFDGLDKTRTVTLDMSTLPHVVPPHVGQVMIDPEAAYVVTGGFGGFGMIVASHLVELGARHVVLAGRSGATTDRTKRQIANWRAEGVTVREALIDIADPYAVDKFFGTLATRYRVKGIIHAAGVVDDCLIGEMTSEQLVRVMRPKVHGAWNLHVCSLKHQLPLDHFVLFSSGSALVGNRGQANYVAANAVLDSLAAYRHARGLPSTSINWGALGEVGMATDEDLRRNFQLMGITPFTPEDAMSALTATLRFQPAQIGIMDVDWVQWGKFEPTGGKSLRFAHLTGARNGGVNASVSESLRHLPAEERFEIVELMLAGQIAQTMRIPPERIDVKQSLTDMGVDSLMAVQLQIAINTAFGVELSALELTRDVSIRQLTTPVLERMGLTALADTNDLARNQTATPLSDTVRFSEADLEKLAPLPQLPGNVVTQQLAL